MSPSDAQPLIRPLTQADIPAALRLSGQNGWNQLEDNWQRQLRLEPDGCFAAVLGEQLSGTACTCIFENIAWVNLVLVDLAQRRRGLGTKLMDCVMGLLEERRVPSIRLDATPLGRPIYEKLGFVPEYLLTRYGGVVQATEEADGVLTAQAGDLDELVEFDQSVTGTPRRKLLHDMLKRTPYPLFFLRNEGRLAAYGAYRPGARAWQIGPCLGAAAACRKLLGVVAGRLRGQNVFIDVPQGHEAANRFAREIGLTPQRELLRMGKGLPVHEQLDSYCCSYGPEKG